MGKPKDYVPLAERECCVHGHVLAEVGIYNYSGYPRCRACAIKSVRKAQLRDSHPRVQLPFAAIDGLIYPHHVSGMPETLQRAYYRSRRQGYAGIDVADHLATFIGRHPFEVWGWDFYSGIDDWEAS